MILTTKCGNEKGNFGWINDCVMICFESCPVALNMSILIPNASIIITCT